jgi:ABC-type multidrug transport system permease subunit
MGFMVSMKLLMQSLTKFWMWNFISLVVSLICSVGLLAVSYLIRAEPKGSVILILFSIALGLILGSIFFQLKIYSQLENNTRPEIQDLKYFFHIELGHSILMSLSFYIAFANCEYFLKRLYDICEL